MNDQRRIFLKSSVTAGVLGLAIGAGILKPTIVLAARPEKVFKSKSVDEALTELFGSSNAESSADINVKAPEIAENGAVVPVTVSTKMSGVESITILAPNNPVPMVAHMEYAEGLPGFISVRLKMGKTGDVVAVVKANGKVYKASKNVKVTIGGCGG